MADTDEDAVLRVCVDNVNPSIFHVTMHPDVKQELEAIDPTEADSVFDAFENFLGLEQRIFQDAIQAVNDSEQDIAKGLPELLLQMLPDAPDAVVIPSIMERTKRPLNHQRFQKEILQEYGQRKTLCCSHRRALTLLTGSPCRWLFSHVDNPYPTDLEKADLAARTGLPLRQVTTWLQNARTRILPKIREGSATPHVPPGRGGARHKKKRVKRG
jgi:hypothetical protein